MAKTINKQGGVVTMAIKVANNPIPDKLSVSSVVIEKKVNQIANAKISVFDGSATTGKFEASSSDVFLLGKKISIEVGYDTHNQVLFSGIITCQSLRVIKGTRPMLEIECRDLAVKLTVGRKSVTFRKQKYEGDGAIKDSDIITSIIGTYSDLSCAVTATPTGWPQQVQYYATDWDFILARAEANGMIVTTLNGKVSVFKPDANSAQLINARYGDGLLEFNADLRSDLQYASVEASAWDYKNQKVSSVTASNNYPGPGNLASKKLADVIGLAEYQLQTTAPLETADLTDWAQAELIKSEYSKIQGEAKLWGTSQADPGKYITLAGLGDRFSGNHLISGVEHDVSDGKWTTTVSVGLSPVWFTQATDVMAPSASGLLPGARGLFNATVKQVHKDPDSQLRILVNIPLFDPSGQGIWARLSNFYSTTGAGIFFLPETDDEVIVGFLNEDPRYPVILGSMYSSSKLPYKDFTPIEKNSFKGIVSKSGIYIKFDDDKKILTVQTPGNNTIILNDKDKQILLSDGNKNSITMNADGITIKSAGNINIQAEKNIALKGDTGITAKASGGDVEIAGNNIKQTADAQYSAQGGEKSTIAGGQNLTLQGAMVMIN